MSSLLQFQKDVADFLAAHPEFQYVPIIREYADEKPGDALLDDQVLSHLKGQTLKNGKSGLVVVISSTIAKTNGPNTPGPVEDLELVIQVVEHKSNNKSTAIGTGVRCDDLCEVVKELLHLHCHNGRNELIVTGSEQDDKLGAGLRGWVIGVKSAAHALNARLKTAPPVVTLNDPQVSIACDTAGASIYYTVNGGFPSPANATATLYTDPFDVSALANGAVIRAAAYSANRRGSDCVETTI